MAHPRVGVIVDRRYLRQEMPEAVLLALRSRRVPSEVVCPQEWRFDPVTGALQDSRGAQRALTRYDLILGRSRSALGLAMLCYSENAGIPTLNTHTSTQRVRNKAKMAVLLGQAGVACAPTVLANDTGTLATLADEWFPLILKATYGDNSQGLRLIRRRDDLRDVHWTEGLVLAQHYLPNDGFDLKLYVCGATVLATRKPSPFNGDPCAAAQVVQPNANMISLAMRCGQVFGLEVFGVDTIETETGLAVIEVNEFPNFTGLPQAADVITDYLLSRVGAGGTV